MNPTTTMIQRSAKGAALGMASTAAMSVLMSLGRLSGARGEAPPRKIVRKSLKAIGVHPSSKATSSLAWFGHFAFGAALGALFTTLVPPGTRSTTRGVAFGLAVWATSYVGVLPSLGVMPKPEHDRRGRAATMFLAHVVFGYVLGRTSQRVS